MKLTTMLVLLFCIQASASSFGQQVTLHLKKQRLQVALNEIQKQTGYSFLMNSSHFNNAKPVTIEVNKGQMREVLDEIFADQPFSYI
ncbi:MAG: hypothetical protein LBE37_11540, partial [Sphingobacterium sp.]|nr:hypothetical protein [Sphingobacterium sp.]